MSEIYISSSWKNRERVRAIADLLRSEGYKPYDFTDPKTRGDSPEIPPEMFPDQFDPTIHFYDDYINTVPAWRTAVTRNRKALEECDACVLLLPCGNDAHADWAYAVGLGKPTAIVGQPRAGERTPTHMWSDVFLRHDIDIVGWLNTLRTCRYCCCFIEPSSSTYPFCRKCSATRIADRRWVEISKLLNHPPTRGEHTTQCFSSDGDWFCAVGCHANEISPSRLIAALRALMPELAKVQERYQEIEPE